MIPDLDIYRGANVIIKQYGQDAPIHAAMNADAMLDRWDVKGVNQVHSFAIAIHPLGLRRVSTSSLKGGR